MQVAGGGRRSVRRAGCVVGLVTALLLAGCGGADDADRAATTSTAATATSADGAGADSTAATTAPTTAEALASTSEAGPGTAEVPASSVPPTLAGASEAQRTAAPDGDGTALLEDVKVGRHDGFERVVFQFQGSTRPGYRIEWVDGPITADGSGDVVEVAGGAHLEVTMQPASGFDMARGVPVYTKADRVPVEGQTVLVADLVRTGDFEAVLTWVVGTQGRVPFTVSTLVEPTRLVIDLQT